MARKGKISAAVIGLIFLASMVMPLFYAYDPHAIDLDSLKEPPGVHHPMGTDQKGRDILARLLEGGMISISVSLLAAVIAMGIGLSLGLISGYFGGKLDLALMGLVDLVLSFPSLLLAIGISVVLPAGIYTVMIAIAFVGWASFARLTRGYVMGLKEAQFVEAARAVGCGHGRVLLVHILPQCMPLALTLMTLKLGGYIITEASLSFLGLGAQPPVATWGSMISQSRAYIGTAPWIAVFPGLAIAVTALSFNLLGDALSGKFGLKVRG
jgi:peptide/nickel transport system permease protein